MTTKKISDVTEKTTPSGTEEVILNDSGSDKRMSLSNVVLTPHALSTHSVEEIVPIGLDSTHARLRLIGTYGDNPSNPPVGQVDFIIVDSGSSQVLRIRYNDGGVIKTGDLALV